LQVLTCQPLPTAEPEFFELLNLYFPCVFDIKYLMKFCDNLHGGLNKLAELLDVQVRYRACVWLVGRIA
jgi:CCR4-NOT transcription complex subunit 7/8